MKKSKSTFVLDMNVLRMKWLICALNLLIVFYFSLSAFNCPAQGVAINVSGDSAVNSAILDIQSDTTSNSYSQGILIPRMSTSKRPANPAQFLQIANTTTNCIEIYIGTTWQSLVCGCTNSPAAAGTISGTATVCPEQSAVLYSVPAIARATSYMWSYSGTGAFIVGSTNAVIVYFSGTATSGNLTVQGTNACGNGSISNNFAIAINSTAPNITVQPASVATCLESGAVTFTVTVSGGLSYQWQEYISSWNNLANAGVYSNVTTATLTITNPPVGMNGNTYRCIVSGTCASSTSDGAAALTVNPIPTSVTATATPNPVFSGNTLTLTGSASGATTWSWTGPNSFSSTLQSPTIAGITTAGSGIYSLTASNASCTATAINTNSVTVAPFSATGGTITYTDASGLNPRSSPAYSGGYTVHTFTSSGTFTPNCSGNVEFLVIGGGGGGGSTHNSGDRPAAGGGGGGFRTGTIAVTAQQYNITIGEGGAGGARSNGIQGSSSIFSNITAAAGGSGAANNAIGGDGGSGGGGSGSGAGGAGNTPSTSPSQGNNGGGSVDSPSGAGGGGGGAGAVGAGGTGAGESGVGGNGGAGSTSSISGVSVFYAGGGGGTSRGTQGSGGLGGGGAGVQGGTGTNGTANTGGGGGGADGASVPAGGAGGSGIVIIRYSN